MQYVKVIYTNGNETAVKLSTDYPSIWEVKAQAFNDKHVKDVVAISYEEYLRHTSFNSLLTMPILGVSVTTRQSYDFLSGKCVTILEGHHYGDRIVASWPSVKNKKDVRNLIDSFAEKVIENHHRISNKINPDVPCTCHLEDEIATLKAQLKETRESLDRSIRNNLQLLRQPRKTNPCACSCTVNPLALMPFAVILGLIVTAIVLH